MDVTSSFKTQIGGDDDDGKKRKKMLAFVALLVVILSVTAWFYIQPLISGDAPAVAPAPIAKNPNKAATPADAAVKSAEDATAGLSKADAAAAAAAAAASATSDPTMPAPASTATNSPAPASEVAVTPAADALMPSASTSPVTTTSAAPAAATQIAAVPAVPPTVPLAVPVATAPAAEPIAAPAAEEAAPEVVADAPADRWEKLKTDNPGTVLPSNDMWVFQTRKLKTKVYVVKKAESLKAISTKLLYSDRFWVKIWSLNPTIADAEVVPVGTEIVLDPGARGTASH